MWYRLKVKIKNKSNLLGPNDGPNKNIEQSLDDNKKHLNQVQSIFDGTDTTPTTYIDKNSSEYNQAYQSTHMNSNKGFYQRSF